MTIPKEIYQGIKKERELSEKLSSILYKQGCMDSERTSVIKFVGAFLEKNAPIRTEFDEWWLCDMPWGTRLDENTYHDEENCVFYFRVEREAKAPESEAWVGYEYYPATEKQRELGGETGSQGYDFEEDITEDSPWREVLNGIITDKLWFWLWLLTTAAYWLQYIKGLIN